MSECGNAPNADREVAAAVKRNAAAAAVAVGLLLVVMGCTSIIHPFGGSECAPVYGNWCGENYPLTGFDPPTVDDWDEACRDHDQCYDGGGGTQACDDALVRTFEKLSFRQLAPQRIHNAHSWFRRDGYVGGWVDLPNELWGMSASCEGGDGSAAEFFCASGFAVCPLRATAGPGRAGMACRCNGFPGRIIEQ